MEPRSNKGLKKRRLAPIIRIEIRETGFSAKAMGLKPTSYNDPLYQLLRDGNVEEFNRRKAEGQRADLTSCELRHLDLRGMDASGLDFSNSHLRESDLRGVDFSSARLEGASIRGAKISGSYFPPELPAEEIYLSVVHGTRMRYRK